MSIDTGTRLGRYEIRSKLGEGGMGEVFLARDTKLDRKVALKILPAEVAAHQDRMKRFVQEAKTASALNHPNIITIYEIEQIDWVNFIATEFIDGETLRNRMRQTPMKLGEVLDVATQIATALSAAHAAGIVHRDIKPENIMLRRDGIVKVLDFGLAKLTERVSPESVDTEAPTRAAVNTEPGVVMGTAIYMSPEQARGFLADARTDIFSLGVLIYEMVAGRLPFEGSNTHEIVSSILNDKEPPPLARYARDVPAELERIVAKALRKNRDERYQTIKDLLLDLKSLKQELEFSAKLEQSAPPAADRKLSSTQAEPAEADTSYIPAERSTTSVARFTGQLTNHKGLAVLVAVVMLVVAATLAYFGGYFITSKSINSLAVLPLANASNDPNTEYLSDGITESIINSLSQLPDLKVMARTTVFRYKGKETDAQKIGKELGVEAVLTGKVLQRGDTLVIQADLVRVSDGSQIWGEQYRRKLSDILVVQSDIAKEISERLRLQLTGAQQQRLAKQSTENAEAYQLYLKGRFYLNKGTDEGWRKSLEFFNQAIEKDPNYALAYDGVADSYASASNWFLPPKEAMPKARAAAVKALELDPTLAEAHDSLAEIKFTHDWDFAGAEKEFKLALELNPNYALAHGDYANFLSSMGWHERAFEEAKRAQRLDPLSLPIVTETGWIYFHAHRYDEAIEQHRKTLEMEPNFSIAHFALGWTYAMKGDFPKAIDEFQQAKRLEGDNPIIVSGLGLAYGLSGNKAQAREMIGQLNELSKRRYVSPFDWAFIYTGLGEKDQAFVWMDKAFNDRSDWMTLLKIEPTLDSLRSDSRYADLMRRVGFTP